MAPLQQPPAAVRETVPVKQQTVQQTVPAVQQVPIARQAAPVVQQAQPIAQQAQPSRVYATQPTPVQTQSVAPVQPTLVANHSPTSPQGHGGLAEGVERSPHMKIQTHHDDSGHKKLHRKSLAADRKPLAGIGATKASKPDRSIENEGRRERMMDGISGVPGKSPLFRRLNLMGIDLLVLARPYSSTTHPCTTTHACPTTAARYPRSTPAATSTRCSRSSSAASTSIGGSLPTTTFSHRSWTRWIEHQCCPRSSWTSPGCRSYINGNRYSSPRRFRASRSTSATSTSTSHDDFEPFLPCLSYCFFAGSQRNRSSQTFEISSSLQE